MSCRQLNSNLENIHVLILLHSSHGHGGKLKIAKAKQEKEKSELVIISSEGEKKLVKDEIR